MSTSNRCNAGPDQVIETEPETETGTDSKSSLAGHVTQQRPKEPPLPPTQPQQQKHQQRPIGDGSAVRQRLAGLGCRLSAKASGCMRKVRRYRGGAGGGGSGGGSLPGPLGRLRDAFDERCCSSGEGRRTWNPFGGETWTREMVRLREDVRRIQFWRAVVGEFIGSLFLILIGCGASVETDHVERPVTVRVALAFGVTYAAGLYCLHTDNDGHLNTAVTVAMAVTRRVSAIRGVLYVATQLLGAVVGASALHWVTSDDYKTELGATRLSKSVSEGQGFLVEFFATSILVFVVFASYDERNKDRTSMAPFVIGLTLMSVSLFSIPYTGGSVNTARSFGPAVVLNSWTNHWIYWFGPILGGVAGGVLHELLFSSSSSFRRVRKCLLLFERRRKTASSNPSVASLVQDPEQPTTKRKKTEVEKESTRPKTTRSSASVKVDADFEAQIDGSQHSWEQSREEEEVEDEEEEEEEEEEDDEEEEDEERLTMRRQKTLAKDGEDGEEEEVEKKKKDEKVMNEEEIEEISDEEEKEEEKAEKNYLRRSSSYIKSVAGTSTHAQEQVLVPIVTASKMRSSISTLSSGSSSRSLSRTVVKTLVEPAMADGVTRLSIHSATAEDMVIDGKYDEDDDDDEEDYSGKGGTLASDDSSDSLEDV